MQQLIMYEEDFKKIQEVCDKLLRDANARVVFVVDRNGQLIASSGETKSLDTTALASLAAGNMATAIGMAKVLQEEEFSTQFHEGRNLHIHIQIVGRRVIIVVVFDNKSSLGLVRLRVKKASQELDKIFEEIITRVEKEEGGAFIDISDEDIDNLFND